MSIVILVGVLYLLVNWESLGKANFQCNEFQDRFPMSHCGYYTTDQSGQFNRIIGIIVGKYIEKGQYFFSLKTTNSNYKEIRISILIPPDPLAKSITTLTPRNAFQVSGEAIDPHIEASTKSFYDALRIGEEVMVDILTPNTSQIKFAAQRFGDLSLFRCVNFQKKFIQYMKNSNLFSKGDLLLGGLETGCSVSTLSIERKS